jgi:hypothetical protein
MMVSDLREEEEGEFVGEVTCIVDFDSRKDRHRAARNLRATRFAKA